ncbi:MAG: tetratricopeptide repeat protein [Planctomycetota bacterium]
MVTTVSAGDEASKPPISAPKAVREGNLLLKAGDAASALEHYRQAETAQPNAREIAFDRGLGHYALGQFDEARQAFEKAAGGAGDALADDAVYSAGACDHAEAFAGGANPKAVLSKLENAMQRYQSVLSRRPEHQAARDANYKAASLWRELKQKLEQQKQQQQQQNDQQDQNQQDQNQEQQQPSEQQKENEQQEQQSAQNQEQQSQEQQAEKQQSASAEQKDNQDEQSKEAQAKEEEQKEDVSREQAERKLREMMQALRDRKKLRREDVKKIPISPVDKDW